MLYLYFRSIYLFHIIPSSCLSSGPFTGLQQYANSFLLSLFQKIFSFFIQVLEAYECGVAAMKELTKDINLEKTENVIDELHDVRVVIIIIPIHVAVYYQLYIVIINIIII